MKPPEQWPPPPPIELTRDQVIRLHRMQILWNRDRARRGLDPYTITDALSKGLDALIAMLEEATNGIT